MLGICTNPDIFLLLYINGKAMDWLTLAFVLFVAAFILIGLVSTIRSRRL